MEFTKQDWGLILDLINISWQCGAVKSPQMGGQVEQLRTKVVAKLEPPKAAAPAPLEKVKGGK